MSFEICVAFAKALLSGHNSGSHYQYQHQLTPYYTPPKLTVVLEIRCLSQTFPRFSATFLLLMGSYGIFFRPSNSIPLAKTQVVILPPPLSTGVPGLVPELSPALEETLETALLGGLLGALELALELALLLRPPLSGNLQLFKLAFPNSI